VHELLRGPEDSRVTLTLRRGTGRSRAVALHRALVAPNTVDMRRIERIVILRITAFNRMTQRRLTRLLVEAMADRSQPPRGFIIDLRGNRGGLLRQAVAVADVFLTDGPIMSTRGRHPDSSRDFEATSADLANGLPVVVLVDGRAASAAEIVAGALQDRRRAVVVGSTTLGKGLVQSVIRLPDDGDLILTWSRVVMPSGYPLQDLGVLPQLCTSLGAALLEAQLRALEQGRVLMAPALASWRASRPGIGPAEVTALRNACPPAEGRDADLEAARWLLERPAPYSAALSAEAEPGQSGVGGPLLAARPPR